MATGTLSANLLLPAFSDPTLAGTLSIFGDATIDGVLTEQGIFLRGTLLPLTASITGTSGGLASFALELNLPTLALLPASALAADLLVGTLAVTGLAGTVGTLAVWSPVLVPALSGSAAGIGILALTGPLARPTVTFVVGGVGTFAGTGRIVVPSLAGLVGQVGTISESLLVPTLIAVSYGPYTGTLGGYLPVVILDAALFETITAAYRAWALNTRRRALTEYDNFNFNSFAQFNGKIVAAGPSGVFELSDQDDDAGTDIAADILTGAQDFGTTFNKRVPRIYSGYSATGPLEFRTTVSKDGTRVYLLPYNGQNALQQRRVPVGRGPKSRYWQFGIMNRDGADFTVSDILVYPEKTVRRVL